MTKHEDDLPTKPATPVPLRLVDAFPPAHDPEDTPRVIHAVPVPDPAAFESNERPTTPLGRVERHRLLVMYFDQSATEDQDYLLKCAERYAARNAKK